MKLALFAFVLAGCGGTPNPPPSTQTISLDTAGAEPRHVLAYAPHSNPRDVTYVTSALVNDDGGGHYEDMMKIHVRWKQHAPFEYRFTIASAEFVGRRQPDIEKTFSDMPEGGARGDAQGRVTAETRGLMHTKPSIPDLVMGFAVSFPTEPVGVGAKWRVSDKRNGTVIGTDVELLSIEGDDVTVHIKQTDGQTDVDTTVTTRLDDFMPLRVHGTQTTRIPKTTGAPEVNLTMGVDLREGDS